MRTDGRDGPSALRGFDLGALAAQYMGFGADWGLGPQGPTGAATRCAPREEALWALAVGNVGRVRHGKTHPTAPGGRPPPLRGEGGGGRGGEGSEKEGEGESGQGVKG